MLTIQLFLCKCTLCLLLLVLAQAQPLINSTVNFNDENTRQCPKQVLEFVDVIQNGDFEIPALGGGWVFYDPGNLSGWTGAETELGAGPIYNNLAWPPSTGQVIELDARRNVNYTQTFFIEAGKLYKFQIQCASRRGRSLASNGFFITMNDQTVINDSFPRSYNRITYSYDFKALNDSITLSLCGAGISDGGGTTCDNVKMFQILENLLVDMEGKQQKCTHCQLQDEACVECQTSSGFFSCDECFQGFFTEENYCYSCRNIHQGCIKCTDSNECLQCQNESLCSAEKSISSLVGAVGIVSYAGLFFSFFCAKIVGLELFGILQLSFFALSAYEEPNSILRPLLKLKMTNGFNLEPKVVRKFGKYRRPTRKAAASQTQMPFVIKQMGYSESFIENVNIMLLLVLLVLLVGLSLHIASRFVYKLVRLSDLLLKQGLVTVLIFNCYNVFFSMGLHIRYARESSNHYYLGWVAIVLTVALYLYALLHMMVRKGYGYGYGEFIRKFKKWHVASCYIPITLTARIFTGLVLSLSIESASLLAVMPALQVTLYTLINLPFIWSAHNYRAGLIHCTHLCIAAVCHFYFGSGNMQLMPAIVQVVALLTCCVVSVVFVGVAGVHWVVGACRKKRRERAGESKSVLPVWENSVINLDVNQTELTVRG